MSKEQKAFKYQSRAVDKGGTKHPKQPQKGHVRVNAGDKCVPPAKSKPKKRKTMNQPDYSTLSMDHVEWCEQSFSVQQLAHNYGDRFPLLVRVANGYNGEFGLQLNKDQVLQIHSSGSQKRVIATDSQQRTISIPHDFPVQVYLPETRETVAFPDAVARRALPLSVEVGDISEELQQMGGGGLQKGEPLYVRSCREELFLRANTISGGWINQREVVLIPAFVPLDFLVAIGMRSASSDEWQDYQNMFARSVRHLLFNLMTGYNGIVTLDAEAASPYRGTSGLQSQFSVGDYQNQVSPTTDPTAPSYQNVSRQPLKNSHVQTNQPAQMYENLPSSTKPQLYENLPGASGSDAHSESPRQPEDNRTNPPPKESRTSPPPKGNPPKTKAKPQDVRPTSPRPDPSVAAFYSGSKGQSSTVHQNKSFEGTSHDNSQFAYDNHVQIEEAEVHAQPSRSGTPFSEIDENDIPDMFNKVIQVGQQSLEKERRANQLQPVSSGMVRVDLNDAVPPPLRPTSTRTATGKAVNVVPPTIKSHPTSHAEKDSSSIETMDDIPEQIESLTVADVGKCLHLLNMDSHVQQFRQHQIDGKLLSDLKDTVMINEFNVTPFNASKIMRFVRGWRPKVT